jgi:glycosyltransferase involved in cell wall biosynthesis
VRFEPTIPSAGMPQYYRELDCLALPSRTTTNWKEQFGRVLIEAMATGVPVVGAQSGEIPSVIGDAGLTFREDDVDELRARLRELQQSREWRELFGGMGRARVLAHFTMQQVANRTLDVYRSLNVGGS